MKDLVTLVADKNMEYALRGLLERATALEIRDITYDAFVHPRRDPGCLNEAHDFLRPLHTVYRHALVVFDHQGCGREGDAPECVANEVRLRLERNGWGDLAQTVVVAPELEVWVWSDSPHVAECLGWSHARPALRQWLAANGNWPRNQQKPTDPKGALEDALRHVRKPRSSAIYYELARRVTLRGHHEPAFARLVCALQSWFPRD